MTPVDRAELLRRLALAAGFEAVGFAPAQPLTRAESYLAQWFARGWAGEMDYLARWREIRVDPRKLLPDARSVIVVAHQYKQASLAVESEAPESPAGKPRARSEGIDPRRTSPRFTIGACKEQPAQARVAQYARGRDYHKVIRKKLHSLIATLREALPEPFDARVCVDTAPLLEREWAAAAGVGWIGKNTLVVNPRLGSFFFLGEVVTTLELAPSEPPMDHCGSCTKCLEACPTGALVAPHQMDARRCISYLTIEHRSEIPGDLQPLIGDWIYGCDICQDACPFNRKAPSTREAAYQPQADAAPVSDPTAVLAWTEEEYRANLAGSAVKRASLSMLQRNARIVLENAATGPRP
jgi:epoxyqueuosine reductase